MSPRDVRKGSAAYWKAKFELAQGIIKEASEKSLNLSEVPGLLPISKVKPKKACFEESDDPNRKTCILRYHCILRYIHL